MPPQIPDEQLGQAVLESARDGVYPASEEVISADVPATALPVLLRLLDEAREEVKVRRTSVQLSCWYLPQNLQIEIIEQSRGTAPDIDGWISQAKQLQAEIESSRALAREIVRQSNAGNSLEDRVSDASSKVDLLKGEVAFNETLVKTLEQIQRIHQLLYSVQEAALQDRLVDAIVWLERAQKEIGLLRTFNDTRIAAILKGKAAELSKAITETIEECWNGLIQTDRLAQRVTIKHETQSRAIPSERLT